MTWLWLSSGLLLGWSVGANVAANIFATAVTARMIRFATAVKLGAVFIVLGGVINGAPATDTISELGRIQTLPAAFAVAAASAAALTFMMALRLPASTAQTAVGALIGYRLFLQGSLDSSAEFLLRVIILTWIAVPLLAGLAAFVLYHLAARIFRRTPMPLFLMDQSLRLGLVAVGCYAAWAFGGNNMASVGSFYAGLDLFPPVAMGPWAMSQTRLLVLLGGLAMCLGIATHSRRLMLRVGRDLMRLDAVTALIAVLSEALVVDFLAHSWRLGTFILPAIPVSTSQALVGAIVGLGLARGIQTIQLAVLRKIVLGWIVAPILAAALVFVLLPLVAGLA